MHIPATPNITAATAPIKMYPYCSKITKAMQTAIIAVISNANDFPVILAILLRASSF